MKIGLISDIHANLPALEAVLSELFAASVDQIICLGDICDLGPEPKETLHRILDLECPIVRGNHDPFDEEAPPELAAITDWCAAQLSENEREVLRHLPTQLEIALPGDHKLLAVHGSPAGDTHGFLPDHSTEQLLQLLRGSNASVICGGHTHVQMAMRLRSQWVVNVGSVGCAFEEPFSGRAPTLLPWAEYAILHAGDDRISVELKQTSYDHQESARRILRSTMPGKEAWAKQFQFNS